MKDQYEISTWVIIPAHNRRNITLKCLEHLKETQHYEQFQVLVVDDGSTDGTKEAIRDQYPDVTILEGDGSLWWGGSIKKGMEFAKAHDADVFIWLNDDVLPEPNGVMELSKKVYERKNTVLSTVVRTEGKPHYTTRNNVTRWGVESLPYETDMEIQPCDVTAGKFTAFSREIVEEIGFPDVDKFPHHDCDYDYILKAKESGFNVGVLSEVEATDTGYDPDANHRRLSPEITLEEVVKNTFCSTRNQRYTLRSMYYRTKRFYGPPSALCYALITYRVIRSLGAIFIKFLLVITKVGRVAKSSRVQ